MDSQDNPLPARSHTRAVLWLVVLGTALGVFLTGMIGTSLALAQGSHATSSVTYLHGDPGGPARR